MSHAYQMTPDDEEDDLIMSTEAQFAPPVDSGVSGKIGDQNRSKTAVVADAQFHKYIGPSTLDEALGETVMRDVRNIGEKIVQVLWPAGQHAVLKDWDLWGPLLFCMTLALMLSVHSEPKQSLAIFTGVFVLVWVGSLVVTLNAQLLGGHVNFFQAVCVLGYCIFPIDIAAIVSFFVSKLYVRAPVCSVALAWSMWAAVNFFNGTRLEQDRSLLAVFPLFMLFFLLCWITALS